MANDSMTVTVAKGQIRSGSPWHGHHAVSWEVLEVGNTSADVREDGHKYTASIELDVLSEWPCIGIETAHGRVMVGERRRDNAGTTCEVAYVANATEVYIVDGIDGFYQLAFNVARWPLLSPPAPQGAEATERKPEEPTGEQLREADRMAEMDDGFPGTSGALVKRLRASASADPREQGPGIARLPRPTVRPDVVVCAEWEERWCGA